MTRNEVRGFLSRLAGLIPTHVPDMANPDTPDALIDAWGNCVLFELVDVDEAAAAADELATRWGLPRWPLPADFADALSRRRNRAGKNAAVANARAVLARIPNPLNDEPRKEPQP